MQNGAIIEEVINEIMRDPWNAKAREDLAQKISNWPLSELQILLANVCGLGEVFTNLIGPIVQTQIQSRLVADQIASQERTALAADNLQKASIYLAGKSLEVGRQGVILAVATGIISLAALVIAVLALKH